MMGEVMVEKLDQFSCPEEEALARWVHLVFEFNQIPKETQVEFRNRFFAFKAAYANRNEWQPIETAPKDGTEILIYLRACGDFPPFMEVVSWRDGYFWNSADLGYLEAATHWMRLPKPPSEGAESADGARGEAGKSEADAERATEGSQPE